MACGFKPKGLMGNNKWHVLCIYIYVRPLRPDSMKMRDGFMKNPSGIGLQEILMGGNPRIPMSFLIVP